MFARDSSLQSDKIKESLNSVDELLSSAKIARREALETTHNLELIKVCYLFIIIIIN